MKTICNRIPWRSVPVEWLDGSRMTDRQHLDLLAEYRRTGCIAGAVLASVADALTPEQVDELCYAGPAVEEIDWAGFDAALAELGEVTP